MTVFTTVGFGDITAKSEEARLLVTVQMIADHPRDRGKDHFGAATRGRQRQPSNAGTAQAGQ